MKKIFSFVFAAMILLVGSSAMAQSETLKGDVNADGVVDVADIAAVIQIMRSEAVANRQTVHYMYVGVTDPTTLNPLEVGNEKLDEWSEIVITPTSLKFYKTDENWDEHYWYLAVPAEYGFSVYDNGGNNITSQFTVSVEKIADVDYTIYKFQNLADTVDGYLKK
jgi:hypothetical protein